MNFLSIFDVIGPNMIGPSSSHTAGAVSIALMARKMFPEDIKKVTFTLYGSFAKTYHGHGTDRALLGGILGFSTDDERIRDAFQIAKDRNITYEYIIDEKTATEHPNTADIDLIGVTGHTLSIRGESIGGWKDEDCPHQQHRCRVYRRVQYLDRAAKGHSGSGCSHHTGTQ